MKRQNWSRNFLTKSILCSNSEIPLGRWQSATSLPTKKSLELKNLQLFLRIIYVIWWPVNCIDSSTNNVWISIFLWWKTVFQLSNTNSLCLKTYFKFSSFNSLPGFNNNKNTLGSPWYFYKQIVIKHYALTNFLTENNLITFFYFCVSAYVQQFLIDNTFLINFFICVYLLYTGVSRNRNSSNYMGHEN